ncbi:DUF6233 domain-containing protein [Streptomyces sp. NBC_00853]|uniref:DUF6233 domain-containing protein n=1 Tax=Streptomyces sp. NBC_00853 TaxID=2903681 RepID=UPI003872D675|nr:DUF6233 domain-containing protein [Streptomyces sp. NBC_00853]
MQILLPQGEVTGALRERRQLPGGWIYLVVFDLWVCDEDGVMTTASTRMWVDAPGHARPVDGVDAAAYAAVPSYPLPAPDSVEQQLGPRRPPGWVVESPRRRGPDRAVIHAVDCPDAPTGRPALTWQQALDHAERPGTRLCALCGAAHELEPLLNGFNAIANS